jgi:hypothetical protein
MTPFELALENDLKVESQRFANSWLFKWHGMTYEGGVTDVDDFRGGRIQYGGIMFGHQQQQVFWQAIDRYLLQTVHGIFKRWDIETRTYSATIRLQSIDGIERNLRQFVDLTIQRALDTDRRLRGKGFPNQVPAFDSTQHQRAAEVEVARVAVAHRQLLEADVNKEKEKQKSLLVWRRLETFYANNKGLIWLCGLLGALIVTAWRYHSGTLVPTIFD